MKKVQGIRETQIGATLALNLFVTIPKERIRHTSNIIGNDPGKTIMLSPAQGAFAKLFRMVHEIGKDGLHLAACILIGIMHFRVSVEPLVEMTSQGGITGFQFDRVADQAGGMFTNIADT